MYTKRVKKCQDGKILTIINIIKIIIYFNNYHKIKINTDNLVNIFDKNNCHRATIKRESNFSINIKIIIIE